MYGFNERNNIAAVGTKQVEAWLSSRKETAQVENVEGAAQYQRIDVDLLWYTQRKPEGYKVEVKVDNYYGTGNFFLETHSNVERGTPGCFLYTEADLFFYYFVDPQHLFILPMPETRDWFLENRTRFRGKERDTTTRDENGVFLYTTRGCLVPRKVVLTEVSGVHEYYLSKK